MTAACLALLLAGLAAVSADGNVGCLFSATVCDDNVEWCFDDYAFGKCQPHIEDNDPADLYRFNLRRESLHMLEREMERLFSLGYRWTHGYTQCVLQFMLYSIREESEYDDSVCASFADQDLNAALKAIEGDEELKLEPNRVAHVKFTPSALDPQSDFADEVYVPIRDQNVDERPVGIPEDVIRVDENPDYNEYRTNNDVSPLRKFLLEQSNKPTKRQLVRFSGNQNANTAGVFPISDFLETPSHFSETYNTPDGFRLGLEARDEAEAEALEEAIESNIKSFSRDYNTPDSFRLGLETKDLSREEPQAKITSFSRNYNTPENFRNGFESRDGGRSYLDQIRQNLFASPEDRAYVYDTFRGGPEDRLSHDLQVLADAKDEQGREGDNVASVFTEGGTVYLKDNGKETTVSNLEELVKDYNLGWGFKRPERLDVKKPGPNFNTNNFAFKQDKHTDVSSSAPVTSAPVHKTETQVPPEPKPVVVFDVVKKKVGSPMESPSLRKPNNYDDNGYTGYIQFKDGVNTWGEGANITRSIAKLLKIDPNAFSHTRVDIPNEMTFRVDPSRSEINASEVVKRIDGIKEELKKEYGVEITSIGIREKSRQPTIIDLTKDEEHQLWLLSFLLCGVIAAMAIAGAVLFVVKRHAHTRDKLNGLAQPDSEASKDYQDLCRARMAAKTAQDKPESPIGRINLGKDGDANQSPSSRSSTSSWSEEPALTNMDISTGHMVLSYMEDHLKNKDRLEQEWIALCAYEAEPCASTIAVKPDNAKKNRYPDIVAYDHARVVLNELLNISGSDYINASTITDHDPRNPAYIATQGPLPNTSADLWQMVWEQGSVVMVMLTRLTENGTNMCHRYWPEEGSEVYHIYEVHLVSEHIWCDDYLVRSFYLKNLKTGETRTVTQFHFLSWPENGVPLSTKALLEFRRKVNKSYRGRSCPIVVHCSDGIGRTGTYCLIDMVLNRMAKGAKEIDIAATLEHIRDQRPLMVKTKQQFEFVLMAVAEEVHAILKALPATHSPPPVNVAKEKE